ncbi:hypothetical protein [Saccharopolyspora pogona]|uniref:hypothetical protein n=1 Tax=Saccharopolyspora pogona TaxID=333966 RepID=UPI0021DF46CC|nr:hypothetical protein [Saccharopolyspora pogona]
MNDRDADPESINRLYFASISQNFRGRRPYYGEVLSTLTADPSELIKDLAAQIHANAQIATIKTRSAKWAIRSALATGAAVAALAITVGVSNSRKAPMDGNYKPTTTSRARNGSKRS